MFKRHTIFSILLFILASCDAKDEVISIPNWYTGLVYIDYDCKNGLEKQFTSDGSRLLNVPPTGYLETQFKFQKGTRDISFQFNDGTPLRLIKSSERGSINELNLDKDQVYIYDLANSDDMWFYIGRIDQRDSLINHSKLFNPQ